LSEKESKKALEFFWKQAERLAATRLLEIGDLVCSETVTLLLKCYLESVICYSLGLFNACIAAACMATEFSLSRRIKEIVSESHGLSNTTPVVLLSENDLDAWNCELDKIRKMPYGILIRLVRNDPRFESLVPTLADHEQIAKIRNAHLHDNPAKLRELCGDSVRETTRNVPSEYRKYAEGMATGLRRIYPSEQALEALRTAKKLMMSEALDQDSSLSSLEKFKRALRQFS
jgi:hypothetical protein